jgi:hypothetical protein
MCSSAFGLLPLGCVKLRMRPTCASVSIKRFVMSRRGRRASMLSRRSSVPGGSGGTTALIVSQFIRQKRLGHWRKIWGEEPGGLLVYYLQLNIIY